LIQSAQQFLFMEKLLCFYSKHYMSWFVIQPLHVYTNTCWGKGTLPHIL